MKSFFKWSLSKRSRRVPRLLVFAISLGILLIELTFLLSDSLEHASEEARKDAYGEWQYAFCNIDPNEAEILKTHPLIRSLGILHSLGPVYSADGIPVTAIGTADEAGIELCRLALYEGSFPQNSHEIAIEAHLIAQLGISADIGDTVALYLETDSDGESAPAPHFFTLTGILRNYEINSNLSDAAVLPGVLTVTDTET